MRRHLWALLALSLTLAACHPPATIVTPQGMTAYTADQIVIRVNELERTAIAASDAGGLPLPTARILVAFCVAADKTLAAAPSGWRATVQTSWGQTKAKLPPITNPAVQAALGAVDAVVGGL